jgi:hypothetical protein
MSPAAAAAAAGLLASCSAAEWLGAALLAAGSALKKEKNDRYGLGFRGFAKADTKSRRI